MNNVVEIEGQLITLPNMEVTLPSICFNSGGWLRTQGKTILGEYSHVYDKQDDLKSEVTIGGATSVWEGVATNGYNGVKMTVSANQSVVRETIYPHYYSKGNGQFYEGTTANFQLKAGFTKRLGYYSSSTVSPYQSQLDGLWFESNGMTMQYELCIYRAGVEVLRLDRSQWTDQLDGTGASGLIIDWTAFEITGGDFLWLGGKGARFYIAVGGNLICVYEYKHAGDKQGLIFSNPNQPYRTEIIGDATAVGSDYLYDICSVVATEGDKNKIGIPLGVDLDANVIKANVIGTYYALMGVKLSQSRRNTAININSFGAFATSNDSFRVTLFKNPTFGGATAPSWVSSGKGYDYFLGDVVNNPSQITVTGGLKMPSIGVSAKSGDRDLALNDAIYQLSRHLTATSDEYVIAVTPLSANLSISGQMDLLIRPL